MPLVDQKAKEVDLVKDKNIERLQQINLKLRNRIKDLNGIVERALEKQQGKFASGAKKDYFSQPQLDPDHMLRVRNKEIENSKKQIDANNNAIIKLRDKLSALGGVDEKGGESNWEQKYVEQ